MDIPYSQYHLLKRLSFPLWVLVALVKDQLLIYVWVYFWLYSVPFGYTSVFMPVAHYLHYYSFVTYFDMRK